MSVFIISYNVDLKHYLSFSRGCVVDFKQNWYNTYLLLSFLITTFINLASKRLLVKIFVGEDADLLLIGENLVCHAMEKKKVIQEMLKTTQICQKSFTDVSKRATEFELDDWVYLKL